MEELAIKIANCKRKMKLNLYPLLLLNVQILKPVPYPKFSSCGALGSGIREVWKTLVKKAYLTGDLLGGKYANNPGGCKAYFATEPFCSECILRRVFLQMQSEQEVRKKSAPHGAGRPHFQTRLWLQEAQ